MTLEDGLHPNAAGHERIARNVADELETLLRRASGTGR
jgi:lysophospholipase L1-like esterase